MYITVNSRTGQLADITALAQNVTEKREGRA